MLLRFSALICRRGYKTELPLQDRTSGTCARPLSPTAKDKQAYTISPKMCMTRTGFGTLAAIHGLGDTVSSIVVGVLWTAIAPAAGFGFGAAFAVAGVLLLPRVVRTPEPGVP